MPDSDIVIRGAREHNLKNFDIRIPRDTLTVITGVSGSGKSSLAFDTIFAEGQRRYVESLSAYARQFLGRMEKPDVDHIEGLSPSISIDQKGVSKNPRSTVGTVTEIYDYLRLLFSRAGRPHCYNCGRPVERQTVQQIVDSILAIDEGTRLQILAPMVTHMRGEHEHIFETARNDGFVRVRVDGETRDLSDEFKLAKTKWHDIEVVVDRIIIREDTEQGRLTESVEAALRLAGGNLVASKLGVGKKEKDEDVVYSEHFACVHCDISILELEPRNFSFNTPFGACPTCTGLGFSLEVDPELVIQDKSLSLNKGAITPWARSGSNSPWYHSTLESLAAHYGFSMDTPVREMDQDQLRIILYGTGGEKLEVSHQTQKGRVYSWNTAFDGVIPNMERRHVDTESDSVREDIARYMAQRACVTCGGARLKPEALAVTVLGMNVIEVTSQSVENGLRWIQACRTGTWPESETGEAAQSGKAAEPLSDREQAIATQILKEVEARLGFLSRVGLDYLTLNRAAATLSGGEGQRIRLATQIGSGLMGVLYVCDEPSVGLHPADNDRLIATLKNLRDVGNTVLIVEHDEAIMRAADHIIDIGPGAGEHGGRIAEQARHGSGFREFVVGAGIAGAQEAAEGAARFDEVYRIAGGEADCASQPVTAIERRCGPAQDFDRFDQADIGVAATARFLRAEGEALRRADAVDLDQHAIAADPADHEILVPRAAQRAQRRPEARRCTAHRDTRFVTDQILDVGHHVIGDVFGVDHGDGGGHIFDSERRAGCGDDDLFALPSCLRGLFTAGGSVLRVNRAGQGRCAQQKRDTESVVPHDDPFVAIDSR